MRWRSPTEDGSRTQRSGPPAETFQRAVLAKVMQQEQVELAEREANPAGHPTGRSVERLHIRQPCSGHWAKGGAKKPRHYEATAKLLRKCYGNVDYQVAEPGDESRLAVRRLAQRATGSARRRRTTTSGGRAQCTRPPRAI